MRVLLCVDKSLVHASFGIRKMILCGGCTVSIAAWLLPTMNQIGVRKTISTRGADIAHKNFPIRSI